MSIILCICILNIAVVLLFPYHFTSENLTFRFSIACHAWHLKPRPFPLIVTTSIVRIGSTALNSWYISDQPLLRFTCARIDGLLKADRRRYSRTIYHPKIWFNLRIPVMRTFICSFCGHWPPCLSLLWLGSVLQSGKPIWCKPVWRCCETLRNRDRQRRRERVHLS